MRASVSDRLRWSHRRFSKRGRSRTARRIGFNAKLEESVAVAQACLRSGLDMKGSLSDDHVTLAAIGGAARRLFADVSTLPLARSVAVVSAAYREEIVAGDSLPRKAKKAHKRVLASDLDQYWSALEEAELAYGLGLLTQTRDW